MLKTTNEKINSKSNICYLMLNYPEVLLACGKVITNKAGTNIPDLTITQPDEIGFSKHGTYFKTTSVVSKKISNMVNIGFFSLFYAINLEKVFSILIINMKQVGDYFNNLLINKYTLYNLFIDNGFARSELSFFDNSVINC